MPLGWQIGPAVAACLWCVRHWLWAFCRWRRISHGDRASPARRAATAPGTAQRMQPRAAPHRAADDLVAAGMTSKSGEVLYQTIQCRVAPRDPAGMSSVLLPSGVGQSH